MSDNWLFFKACGHPFGLHVATPTVQTERQAWNAFYDTEKQRRAVEDRGVTCRRVDHDTYREQWAQFLRDGCDCEPAPEPMSAPTGRGVCPVCGKRVRVLKNGAIGVHNWRPRGIYDGRSNRCDGAGNPPKETQS